MSLFVCAPTSPPPYSRVIIVFSLHLLATYTHTKAGRGLRKQESPRTTQIKDEELLLIKHSWNHSHVPGKVSESDCLWRICPYGWIIFSDIRLPKSMQQTEKCLENKQLILFWPRPPCDVLIVQVGLKINVNLFIALEAGHTGTLPHGARHQGSRYSYRCE